MSVSSKQWTLASLGLASVLAVLFVLGGYYRAVLVLLLPLGFWLSLRQEPEQRQVRAWVRVVGWFFVAFSVVVLIASVVAVAAGR